MNEPYVIKSGVKLTYGITRLESLTSLFALIREIQSESGLNPETFSLSDGRLFRYDKVDALFVEKRALSEIEYLKKHILT